MGRHCNLVSLLRGFMVGVENVQGVITIAKILEKIVNRF
jgi:hypothetical protein